MHINIAEVLTAMTEDIEDPFVDLLTDYFTANCLPVTLLIIVISYMIKTFYENYDHICYSYFSQCYNSSDSNQHHCIIGK